MKAGIIYFGKMTEVECDGKCNKAWGINSHPRDEHDNMIDDSLLDNAPKDPGTYEGSHGKPKTTEEFPNKWCVRECERCSFVGDENES